MRIKKFTLMTLTFVMMSVVAFAQQTEQKALPSLKKQPTLKQQILQAKREGKELNKETIAQFKYNKPAASQIIKKQQRNLSFPVQKLGVAPAKGKASVLQVPGKAKTPRRGGTQSYVYHFISSANGWTNIDADGDGYKWELSSSSGPDSEAGVMASASYDNTAGALTPDNYLVSPKMKLDGKITFWASGQDASWAAEHFGVAVSTTGNTSAADFTTIQEWTMTAAPSLAPSANFGSETGAFRSSRRVQGTWYEYTIDLSSYAGAEGYVAIRHFNCTDNYRLNVDDITLETSELLGSYDPTVEVMPEKVKLPDGATVTPYYTIDGTLAVNTSSGWSNYTKKVKNINVAFVGTDVYIQGLSYWQQESWVKGTLADNVITVPSGQYVGDGEYLNGMDDSYAWLASYTFTIDAEAGTIACNEYIGESESPTANSLYAYWMTPVFSLTAPADPRVTPPAGLVTEDWFFAGYFYDGENETPTEKPLKIGFDGKDVYVQGIGYYQPEAWIKGTLSDDGKSITFASGQYYGTYADTYDMWFAAVDTEFNYLESVTATYDAENGVIVWPGDAYILENGDAAEVSAYGLCFDVFAIKGAAPAANEMPTGLLTEEWALKAQRSGDEGFEEYKSTVNVGIAGNDVYVLGLFEGTPDAILKGTLDPATNKVTFKTGQCMGVSYEIDWNTFSIIEVPIYFAGYGENGLEDVVMAYDAAKKTLTMESPLYCFENGCWLLVNPYDIYADVVLQAIPDVAATPAQPMIYESKFVDTSYPNISVNIPLEDVDGNPILSGKLFYRYYYKQGGTEYPLTLTTDLYTELTEDMTVIPYNFSDDWDVYNYRLYLNMPFADWDQIGIQSIYCGGGEEKKSEIFWYDVYQPEDVTITVEPGTELSQTITDKAAELKPEFKKLGNITLELAAGDYTFTKALKVPGSLTINGNGATITSAGDVNFIELSGTTVYAPKADGTNSDHFAVDNVTIKDVTVKGLKKAIIRDLQKSLLNTLVIDNSVIQVSDGKPSIDFDGKGYIGKVTILKSTLWAPEGNNKNLAKYGSRPKNVDEALLQEFDIQNSTLVNMGANAALSSGQNFNNLKQQGTAQNVYTVKNSIFVNCGKNGQTVVGLNGGQTSATPQWDVTNNSFAWNGVSTNANEISKAGQKDGADIVKRCIEGVPVFADAANGNFKLGNCAQNTAHIGDPRWLDASLEPAPENIVVSVEPGANLNDALFDATTAVNKVPKNITINLAAGDYTITASITSAGNVVINGNKSTIDASALSGAFIVLDGTEEFAKKADGSDSDHKLIEAVTVKGVTITGMTGAFIKDNQKTLLEKLTVDNCVIEMPASNKNFIDFNGKGYVGEVKVQNSTIWSAGMNTGFFAQYGSRPKNVNGDLLQVFDVENSDIINIANGKNVCDLKQNGTAQNVYILKSNMFVDCGKNGQTVVGFNKGQTSSTPQWDVTGNTFVWGGECTNEAEVTKAGQKDGEDIVKNCVDGVPEFANAASGDFTLGASSIHRKYRVGDPRWFSDKYIFTTVTDPIDVTVPGKLGKMDGEAGFTDLYYFLEYYLKDSENPVYIKLTLEPNEIYTISQPLNVMTSIEIAGSDETNALIYADALGANPFVQIHGDWVPTDYTNEKGFYDNINKVVFKNLNLVGMKGQVFYANKQKYLISQMTVDNCQLRMYRASKKTFFDFSGGGFVEQLTVNNSTLSADDATTWANGGFFSTQSGTKLSECGAYQQKFVLTNNTFYNVSKEKTTSTLRESGKDFMSFEVLNNIFVNSGKKGQFIKGLNAAGDSNNPSWIVKYNSFQWSTDNATYEDTSASEVDNVKKFELYDCIEGEVAFKYNANDGEAVPLIFVGNYTLADCPQKTAKIGDPRWLDGGATGIQTLNADKQGEEGAWYTIQGVRVDKPSKGVFIHNGKKVVVK